MPDLFECFRAVVGSLVDARVPFAVCGGIAMSIHARPRATIDIDLLAPSDAIPSLEGALAPLGFVRRGEPLHLARGEIVLHRLTRIVSGDPDVLGLDVIEVRSGATGRAWETRLSLEWEECPVTVVSREGLIALKRLGGSPRDLADIDALEESS